MKRKKTGSGRRRGVRNAVIICVSLLGIPAVSYVSGISVHGLIACLALIGLGAAGPARFLWSRRPYAWLQGVSLGLVASCAVTGFIAMACGYSVPLRHVFLGLAVAGICALNFFACFEKRVHAGLAVAAVLLWGLLLVVGFLNRG